MKTASQILTESDIQRESIKLLRLAGWIVIRLNSGKARHNVQLCPPGTPDILAISKTGRTLWIEFKALGGKLRPEQIKMHADLILRNQQVYVVRTLEDVRNILAL